MQTSSTFLSKSQLRHSILSAHPAVNPEAQSLNSAVFFCHKLLHWQHQRRDRVKHVSAYKERNHMGHTPNLHVRQLYILVIVIMHSYYNTYT